MKAFPHITGLVARESNAIKCAVAMFLDIHMILIRLNLSEWPDPIPIDHVDQSS